MTSIASEAHPAGRLPRQIPYIIGNEACERFSFYGMRNILVTFLVGSVLLGYLPESEREGDRDADVEQGLASTRAGEVDRQRIQGDHDEEQQHDERGENEENDHRRVTAVAYLLVREDLREAPHVCFRG